ncbi:uncharacterized protein LOC130797679 isoform X2 [Amaranthus tricolor]|uniref:uncharacterized protein LOC130797679 isoform X2 n=1 Tax=Amaranthus tricolor TaxID=29722 RepID=UPI0025902E58|nr:uncharacterized protein LOC130797679 isoform X2 [Amaranthus tricolor]
MATAAFRSTTGRTSVGDSNSSSRNSSSHHRRSRSVSRFSHRIPSELSPGEPPSASRKGKFVNTVRGSGVPEISLDDLAIEMFSSSDIGERGRLTSPEVSSANNDTTASNYRRGRSVSRRGSRVGELRSSNNVGRDQNGVSDGTSRRRRSLSVVRNQVGDSQIEHSWKSRNYSTSKDVSSWSKQKPQVQPTSSNQQRGLRRCSSQKDFLRSYDGYSSYSSTLTDDEGNDTCYVADRKTKGMEAAFGQNKVKAENQLSELANAADADVLKAVSDIRRNYKTKLEESDKRKQELLAEIMLEEERGKELKKIVGELLPNPKSSPVKRTGRGRKRSNDRFKSSKQLVEDADRIIEDFISSVEETDMSSFDGERSDTSSVFGGTAKPALQYGESEFFKSPLRSDLLSGEMDGVVLPWLKWETGNDGTPLSGNDNKKQPTTPRTVLQDTRERSAGMEPEQSFNSKSSRGSWSPEVVDSFSLDAGQTSIASDIESCKIQLLSQVPRKSRVDTDNYLKLPSNEGYLSERWKQQKRIESGGLLICNSGKLGEFLF